MSTHVFFLSPNQSSADDLWSLDTSTGATFDLHSYPAPFSSGDYLGGFVSLGGKSYFTDLTGSIFGESDGPVDASNGKQGSFATVSTPGTVTGLTSVDGRLLYFSNGALWSSDGKTATNLKTLSDYVNPQFTQVGGTTFFVVSDGTTQNIWKTDGTAAGTALVKTLPASTYENAVGQMMDYKGELYFEYDQRLWKSDGTAAGTTIAVDTHTFPVGNVFGSYTKLAPYWNQGTLFAHDEVFAFFGPALTGQTLWLTDGVTAWDADSTITQGVGFGGYADSYGDLTSSGGKLYYIRTYHSGDTWSYFLDYFGQDGSGYINEITMTSGFANAIGNLTDVAGTMFFTENDGVHGLEVAVVSATGVQVLDVNPGAGSSGPSQLTNIDGTLYFVASADGTHYYLYKAVESINATNGAPTYSAVKVSTQPVDPTQPIQVLEDPKKFSAPNDFSGDHRSDLLFQKSDGTLAVWDLNTTAVVGTANLGKIPAGWKLIQEADFNGDGHVDLLLDSGDGTGNGNLEILETNGQSVIATVAVGTSAGDGAYVPYSGNRIAAVGDFDGDGKADMLLYDGKLDTYTVLLMDGGLFKNRVGIGEPQFNATVAAVGDFNGDGKADILWKDNLDGSYFAYFMDGGTIIGEGKIATPPAGWTVAGIGDFNGDGNQDILWNTATVANPQFSIWEMNGLHVTATLALPTIPAGVTLGGVGDYNGDGKSDLLLKDSTGIVTTVLLNGATSIGGALVGNIVLGTYNTVVPPLQLPTVVSTDASGNFRILQVDLTQGGVANDATIANPLSGVAYSLTGDINGDGQPDVIEVQKSGAISALLTNSSHALGAAVSLGNGGGAFPLALADVTGDGHPDLVLGKPDGTILIWQMNGTSVGTKSTLLQVPTSWNFLGAGDFNGDHKADLAFQENDPYNPQIHIVEIGANATVLANVDIGAPQYPYTFTTIGDFNGDGKSDFLFSASDGSNLTWEMNGTQVTSNSGFLGDSTSVLGAGMKIVGSADYNGDGKSDLVVENSAGATQIVLMNGLVTMAGGAFLANLGANSGVLQNSIQSTLLTANRPSAAYDFGNDYKSDILFRNAGGTTYLWTMNGATVADGSPTSIQVGTNWQIKGIADFNGDGSADILWAYNNAANASDALNGISFISLQQGASAIVGSNVVQQLSSVWQVAGVGDFNGDGKADVLYRNTSTGQAYLDVMNGSSVTWASSGYTSQQVTNQNWQVAAVADFNGDGEVDVLWRYNNASNASDALNGTLYEWQMNGTSVTNPGLLGNAGKNWQVAGTGDFNGDGNADILFRYENASNASDTLNGFTYIDFMNGKTVTSGAPTQWQVDNSWAIASIGDYNGDGMSDILLQQTSTGKTYEWQMNGASVTAGAFTSSQAGLGWTVQNGVLIA